MDRIQTASAGALSSATAAITTDLELNKIMLVGIMGALAYIMKSVKIADVKAKPAMLLSLPFMILMPMSLTVAVYYLGTDGFNMYVKDVGEPIWTAIGLMFALNNDHVFNFIGRTIVMERDKKFKDTE